MSGIEDGERLNEKPQDRRLIGLIKYGKIVVFLLLCVLLIILVATNLRQWEFVLPFAAVLLVENAFKIFVFKNYGWKIACYVLDVLLMLGLTCFTDGSLISTIYIALLSEFYLGQKRFSGNLAFFLANVLLYLIMFGVSRAIRNESVIVAVLIRAAVNDLILLAFHFLAFNFALQVFRKNREIVAAMDELKTTVEELNESNQKLQEANRELERATVLAERQRIAKEIHDTAGHAITTVIMQTEAAKLVVESDPQEAKKRITAANIQAKRALKELRENVHVLSGIGEFSTLKEAILAIVAESTDGTGVVIRYDLDDLDLGDEKNRFILNTLKEGISNGMRHGGATAFWLELKAKQGNAEFFLSDNGEGQEKLNEGFGLSGMRRRAESLGGQVSFETEKGEGFEIRVTLPLPENK